MRSIRMRALARRWRPALFARSSRKNQLCARNVEMSTGSTSDVALPLGIGRLTVRPVPAPPPPAPPPEPVLCTASDVVDCCIDARGVAPAERVEPGAPAAPVPPMPPS